MLKGKTILIGITGGIAAYKIPSLVRKLKAEGANVLVMMTKAATKFVSPLVLEVLSGNQVWTDIWDDATKISHIKLAQKVDVVMIVPATANFIGKYAHGIADDLVLTTLLATKVPVVIFPSMNSNMWEHPAVKDNVQLLKQRGTIVIEPDAGELACGTTGPGRLPSGGIIVQWAYYLLGDQKILNGKKILITAGATREYADPVRFISNGASGKMGRAFGLTAAAMGAEVTMVSGPNSLPVIDVVKRIDVVSAEEMNCEVMKLISEVDLLIATAAVADFCFDKIANSKMKKIDGIPDLKPTVDVLLAAAEIKKSNQVFIGFALESTAREEDLMAKMKRKKIDLLIHNHPQVIGKDEIDCEIFFDGGRRKVEGVKKISMAEDVLNTVKLG